MRPSTVLLVVLAAALAAAKRKTQSGTDRAFEKNKDDGLWTIEDEKLRPWAQSSTLPPLEEYPTPVSVVSTSTSSSLSSSTTTTTTPTSDEQKANAADAVHEINKTLLSGVRHIDLLKVEAEETAGLESANATILWIDAKWKAEERNINLTAMSECKIWREHWEKESNETFLDIIVGLAEQVSNETSPAEAKMLKTVESEIIDSKKRAESIGLEPALLKEYKAVGIVWREVCGLHERDLWFRKTEDAKLIGVTEASPICHPFKEQLNPDTKMLRHLAEMLNEIVSNVTEKGIRYNATEASDEALDLTETIIQDEETATRVPSLHFVPFTDKDMPWPEEEKTLSDSYKFEVKRGVLLRVRRETQDVGEAKLEDEWLDEKPESAEAAEKAEVQVQVVEEGAETPAASNKTSNLFQHRWIEIDATEETNPSLSLLAPEAIDALSLSIPADSFKRFGKVSLYLPGICAEYVPRAVDEFNSSSFEGIEIEGPIGVNVSALEAAGVNLTALAEKLRNDTEVDEILTRTNGSVRTLGGSYILPVLNKNQYDPFSAPIVFQGSAVSVRFGIYIESMSNFQTSTMDYDMDIYLMMAWRDARLVNPYEKPILVKEEEILEKIWRPDPFFANAKEAEFHEVTFLNFLMRIFPDGLVLYETRIKLRPACNLILCKYPHDKQVCELQIKSFAYPIETVRFEWFTRNKDAIDKNPDVKLPELYIDRYEPKMCNRTRKSGDFSCLRAVFRLKRDVGYHVAQTYIPTSLALMFSWVGVWLPEEFMEGRIGVAITVLLTLSTESAGAREHLPSVSYLKAIDLWFGFITGFVFFTLLQTLFVIGFDKRAGQLRKWAMRKKADVTEELREAILTKAARYHKTGRYLDNFCRVFYPLSFILFLIMYYFVFTEGRQDDCISRRD